MKRLSFQILMFVICMIVSLVLFYVMEKQIYNRINIVNDKQAVLQRVNESLPIEVKVRHEKWGEIVVTDEVRLHTIVSFFDRIRIEPEGVRPDFSGNIFATRRKISSRRSSSNAKIILCEKNLSA